MWERFSYYGDGGILVLYLTARRRGGLGPATEGTTVSFARLRRAGLPCTSPAPGWPTACWAGAHALLGAVLIMLGPLALSCCPAWPRRGRSRQHRSGRAPQGELDRDRRHPLRRGRPAPGRRLLLYYLGINLGALIGPLLTGWLQVTWGFHRSASPPRPWAWRSGSRSTRSPQAVPGGGPGRPRPPSPPATGSGTCSPSGGTSSSWSGLDRRPDRRPPRRPSSWDHPRRRRGLFTVILRSRG